MQSSLVSFIQVLRSHDVRVSPAESLEAVAVAAALGYADRSLLRDGLAMTLAKTAEEETTFLQCFDRFFSHDLADFAVDEQAGDAGDEPENPDANDNEDTGENGQNSADNRGGEGSEEGAGGHDSDENGDSFTGSQADALRDAAQNSQAIEELLGSRLMQNLMNNDRNELTMGIAQAAERVGLAKIEMFTQRGQFTRRILDAMGEEQIRGAVIELEQADSPALPLVQRYRDILREQVRDYVEREYLLHAEGRNRQFMDDILSRTRLNNIEHVYMHKVQELIRRMAKKLASRHARKRRNVKRGNLNMPKTLRRGVPNDGVLFDVHWRQVKREKPKVLAVCDVSGSVAPYAKFLLLFLYSLQDVLPRVRSFAFSSHLGEVSDFFADYPVEKAIEMINWKYGGATDYGNSLQDFINLAIDDVDSNTTVIILGDARNNNADPRLDLLQGVYQRARQVIWLNPESRRSWGTGDSEMPRYLSACHFAAECNNLKQLERVVDQLLKSTR